MEGKYADVIIDISHEKVDRVFQYKIPDGLKEKVNIGTPVTIPFGRGNTKRQGYVVGISDEAQWEEDKIKDILEVPPKQLSIESRLIELAGWMKEHYGSTMIAALKTVAPVKEKVRKVSRKDNDSEEKEDTPDNDMASEPIELNSEQKEIVEEFCDAFETGVRGKYLLHGVTGSGKTEVYIELVKEVVSCGKSAIVLIPEISLTLQTVERFEAAFGDRISIINSRLSKGEKYTEFERARKGETDLIIGPRSALFAPFSNLGLIIIDEEHDTAYKSETTPKYHARETAMKRAELEDAAVVLGSATPSIESYHRALSGEYKLWSLPDRVMGRALAKTSIVDLREELKSGNRSIISRELAERMEQAFAAGEQVMLFINRRGYSSFVSCRSCGYVIKCPKCDVTLALHGKSRLMCHYCGYQAEMPDKCPACSSKLIGGYGTGTEKVEAAVKSIFPNVRTLRMDKDTTTRKDSHQRIINSFKKHKADCLIGTQMIVKGHDFGNVTVVGIVLADLSLFDNDYTSAERTFDLLTQAAGRAGRGEKPGYVVIQTYQPEHYTISSAAEQDYNSFYQQEISYRRLMKYPPASHMLGILITSKDEELADRLAASIADKVREILSDCKEAVVTGPGPAYIGRINESYRRVIYARDEKYDKLTMVIDKIDAVFGKLSADTDAEIQFDMDPMNVV
ncbi:MAG: primosomal protein N' [Eubacterium sp.]|nr:primosomal protein N' [Eubacterium sp.]